MGMLQNQFIIVDVEFLQVYIKSDLSSPDIYGPSMKCRTWMLFAHNIYCLVFGVRTDFNAALFSFLRFHKNLYL